MLLDQRLVPLEPIKLKVREESNTQTSLRGDRGVFTEAWMIIFTSMGNGFEKIICDHVSIESISDVSIAPGYSLNFGRQEPRRQQAWIVDALPPALPAPPAPSASSASPRPKLEPLRRRWRCRSQDFNDTWKHGFSQKISSTTL